MKCYTVTDMIHEGIDATLFDCDKLVHSTKLKECSFRLSVEDTWDIDYIINGLKQGQFNIFEFGLLTLIPATEPTKLFPASTLLIQMDCTSCIPSPELGDKSVLLTTAGSIELRACRSGDTFIQVMGSKLLINTEGCPELIDATHIPAVITNEIPDHVTALVF